MQPLIPPTRRTVFIGCWIGRRSVAAYLSMSGIVSVTNEGGCHDATIVPPFGPTDPVKALAICESAAEVAYAAGDISSITVTAADNTELAIGIKGQPCIGEP